MAGYFFAQFSGSALSISYTTVFFRQVGGINPFTATMIRRATGLLDPILSLYIIDRLVSSLSQHPLKFLRTSGLV